MSRWLLSLVLRLFSAAALAATPRIERVEPASWWVGMKNSRLQLLVHGEHIAALEPAIQDPRVTLARVTRTSNPNYLFVDLVIADGASPGTLDIGFRRGTRTVLHHAYELNARAPGSAERKGFGPADAIYLVTPDRFANGNPENDNAAGYRQRSDRADPDGRHGGDLEGLRSRLDYIADDGLHAAVAQSRAAERPAARVVPRLCDYRLLPDRRPARRQCTLPFARLGGSRQGHRRDHGRDPQPLRLGALVDEGPPRSGLDQSRGDFHRHDAPSRDAAGPPLRARGPRRVHRRLVRADDAGPQPEASPALDLPDTEHDLVDRVRGPLGPQGRHALLFRSRVPGALVRARPRGISRVYSHRRGVEP